MKFKYFEPDSILSVVTVLIVLEIGIYVFFITISSIQNIPTNTTNKTNYTIEKLFNISGITDRTFSLIPIVFTLGFVCVILSFVFRFISGRDYEHSSSELGATLIDSIVEDKEKKEPAIPINQTNKTSKEEEKPLEKPDTRKRYNWNRGKE